MEITLVVAHTENRVIGKDGGMPWHLPADLAHFKAVTMGKPMIMGRRTFESIGKALPGRRSIVVTRDPSWSAPGVEVAHSVDDALALCEGEPEVAVIGGGQLFDATLDKATRIHQTIIHTEIEGDTHFPELDLAEWHETARETRPPDDRNEYGLSFVELRRRRAKDKKTNFFWPDVSTLSGAKSAMASGVARRGAKSVSVALVTCDRFPSLYEDDHLLVAALDGIGVGSQPAVWSDTDIDWGSFDALVMRSPWDYFERPVEFRAWLDVRIADGARLLNPAEILVWNFDKSYLQDIAAAGVPLVPTVVVPQGGRADVAAIARAQGWDEIVAKPTIAGGAYATHRFRVGDADRYREDIERTLQDRGLLVQPFLPEITSEGELSLLFFDGEFSHAVRKRPKAGDYRVQFQFGGTSEPVDVRDEWVEAARVCIATAPVPPVYARVDGVIRDGQFVLMELEVFEPVMFLARDPDAPARFARAIEARL